MKKAIVTLAMALALVGLAWLGASMAATPHRGKTFFCAPGYTHYMHAPGSCSVMGSVDANTPSSKGAAGH